MILVTGATGFVGRRLLQSLESLEIPVRILLRPTRSSPRLPRGHPFEVALASLTDPRGVRAAVAGVETIIHLATAEHEGHRGDLAAADVRGTANLAEAAEQAGAERVFYLSHLGASPSSAYPVLRAKAAAEAHLRRAGVPHLILRCGLLFGPGDHFTTALAQMLSLAPGALPVPGDADVLLHPLWIEDLITSLEWLLEDPAAASGTYEIGGPEHLSLQEVLDLVGTHAGARRSLVHIRPAYLRGLTWASEHLLRVPPATTHFIDYLAMNRTAPLDSIVRLVGLQPKRMKGRLGYLEERRWGWELLQAQFRRQVDGFNR